MPRVKKSSKQREKKRQPGTTTKRHASSHTTGRGRGPLRQTKSRRQTTVVEKESIIGWLEDYETVVSHLEQFGDLEQRVRDHGGLLRIPNFLPRAVARFIYDTLRAIPDTTWIETAADEDVRQNNINHAFYSCKNNPGDACLASILRVFTIIFPDDLSVFSAAKYVGDHSHGIERHDDRAYVPVKMEDTGEVVTCSRKVALIYYLGDGENEPWHRDKGGMLIDCEASNGLEKHEYAPDFNSLIVFQIPRYHIVTPVKPPCHRYSIFGWTLEPGTSLYPLATCQGSS